MSTVACIPSFCKKMTLSIENDKQHKSFEPDMTLRIIQRTTSFLVFKKSVFFTNDSSVEIEYPLSTHMKLMPTIKTVKCKRPLVYKQAFDTRRGGRIIHHTHTTTQYTIQVAFLRKDPRLKTKNNYTMSMGEHRNEILVVKIIFSFYINGGAQEGKHDFIKNIFQWWKHRNENLILHKYYINYMFF